MLDVVPELAILFLADRCLRVPIFSVHAVFAVMLQRVGCLAKVFVLHVVGDCACAIFLASRI